MAVNTSSYFSNSIQGIPTVGPLEFDLFGSSSTPKHAVGHMVETQDGRRFRYAHFGAATAQGLVVSQDVSESAAAENAITVVAPASAATTTDGTAGHKYIEGTIAAITRDQYAGGYLITCAGTGRGYMYRIKGNTVCGLPDGPASGNIRIQLYDKLQETLTADTDIVIIGSKYANLEASSAGTDEVVSGVTVDNMSASTYGWIQTRGPASVKQHNTSALAVGDIAVLSTYANGQVARIGQFNATGDANESATEPIIGNVLSAATAAVDGSYVLVDLILE